MPIIYTPGKMHTCNLPELDKYSIGTIFGCEVCRTVWSLKFEGGMIGQGKYWYMPIRQGRLKKKYGFI